MVILKSYENPIDVYVIGTCIGTDSTFSITDDESELTVKKLNGAKGILITTAGFVTIITKDEISKADLEDLTDAFSDDDTFQGVFLKNFKGDINLKVTSDEKVDVTEEFDLTDYIEHQVYDNDEYDYVDIELILPNDCAIELKPISELVKMLV